MRAIQIVEESGPGSGLALVELPEPEPSHMLTPGSGVVVEVHAAGVSFPELLQTRGLYQMKPPLPFVPSVPRRWRGGHTRYSDRLGPNSFCPWCASTH